MRKETLRTIPGVINLPISSYSITYEGRDKTICDSLASAIPNNLLFQDLGERYPLAPA